MLHREPKADWTTLTCLGGTTALRRPAPSAPAAAAREAIPGTAIPDLKLQAPKKGSAGQQSSSRKHTTPRASSRLTGKPKEASSAKRAGTSKTFSSKKDEAGSASKAKAPVGSASSASSSLEVSPPKSDSSASAATAALEIEATTVEPPSSAVSSRSATREVSSGLAATWAPLTEELSAEEPSDPSAPAAAPIIAPRPLPPGAPLPSVAATPLAAEAASAPPAEATLPVEAAAPGESTPPVAESAPPAVAATSIQPVPPVEPDPTPASLKVDAMPEEEATRGAMAELKTATMQLSGAREAQSGAEAAAEAATVTAEPVAETATEQLPSSASAPLAEKGTPTTSPPSGIATTLFVSYESWPAGAPLFVSYAQEQTETAASTDVAADPHVQLRPAHLDGLDRKVTREAAAAAQPAPRQVTLSTESMEPVEAAEVVKAQEASTTPLGDKPQAWAEAFKRESPQDLTFEVGERCWMQNPYYKDGTRLREVSGRSQTRTDSPVQRAESI